MALKYTVQGLLIYLVMATFLLSAVLAMAHSARWSWRVYAGGFVLACASVGFRWWYVGHAPLQNLFEIFLILAVLLFPLSLTCRVVWKMAGHHWDALIGVLFLVPAGFIFSDLPRKLPPALQSPLFIPHVMVYMIAYVLLAKATIQAILQLRSVSPDLARVREGHAAALARAGLVMLTIGLILGAWWGKLAWGDYWTWDPKEMWSLATWLIFVAYFHFRAVTARQRPKLSAAFLLVGMAAVILTLLLVSLVPMLSGKHSYAS